MSLYLEAELGALAPSSNPPVTNGVQQLDPGTDAGIMTFLADKYFIPDAAQPASGGTNYVAVSAEYLVTQGYQLEGQQTAAQALQALPAGQVAVANLDDVNTVATSKPLSTGFHVTVADASVAAGYAAPGSNFAVIWPLGGSYASPEAPKKSMTVPVTFAVVGAVGGALVGGVAGAAVGGVAGFLLGNATA